jgi:transposase-like protein
MAKTRRKKRERDQWDDLVDQIDFKGLTQDEVLGRGGLLKQLTGRVLQKALEAEMTSHLGYEKHDRAGDQSGNSRNGYSGKTVLTENQEAVIPVPRDRQGTFEPEILPKYQKRVPLFNDQILSMYSFGMTNRDIKSHLEQVYNVEVSPELTSQVTDAVMEDVREWQSRPLEKSYAIVYLDALRVNSRQDGKSCPKSVYVALGVNFEGKKEVLGLWIAEHEGAKFWASVLNDIRNRGTVDILIACMDGLTGFPDAVRAVFPDTRIQRCIVHMVRNSVKFVSYKDLKAVCGDLKAIYRAPSEEAGRTALEEFGEKWKARYPLIYQSWNAAWPELCGFFKYPDEIRRVIYTTNAIESLNYQLRKVTRNRSVLAGDEAIYKIMYLALQNAAKKWTMPIKEWDWRLTNSPLFLARNGFRSELDFAIYTNL